MANFNSDDYGRFIDSQEKSAQRYQERVNSIQEGSHILVFNPVWAGRNPEKEKSWKQVEKIMRFSDDNVEVICTDGTKVSGLNILLVAGDKTVENLLICLNDRKQEFVDALRRANTGEFEVFADWEPDTFTVVNLENNNEYQVCLKTINGRVFASCECGDFLRRSRVCKHISLTLQDAFFGTLQMIVIEMEAAV